MNLTELIAQYQQHASDAEKRADTTETKLANLRKLVMQLLKPSLNFVSFRRLSLNCTSQWHQFESGGISFPFQGLCPESR